MLKTIIKVKVCNIVGADLDVYSSFQISCSGLFVDFYNGWWPPFKVFFFWGGGVIFVFLYLLKYSS